MKILTTGGLKPFNNKLDSVDALHAALVQTAYFLKDITSQHQPKLEATQYWDQLINDWIEDKSLPLFIRKSGAYARGSELIHSSGRILIPSDNGPAHWSFSMCINQNLVNLEDIRNLIDEDQIPIAFALKAHESGSKYKQTQHLIDTPNKKGWKIAHIDPVGLKSRKKLEELETSILEDHFRKFMSPSNMFLIPLAYAGLAEIDEILEVFK